MGEMKDYRLRTDTLLVYMSDLIKLTNVVAIQMKWQETNAAIFARIVSDIPEIIDAYVCSNHQECWLNVILQKDRSMFAESATHLCQELGIVSIFDPAWGKNHLPYAEANWDGMKINFMLQDGDYSP